MAVSSRAMMLVLLAFPVLARPRIDAVVNAASNALPPASNAAIARGAMFVLYGAEQGPADLVRAASFPLPLTLGGTSVQVTVGGVTADAIPVYSSASQVAAILPSRVPAGTGTIRVTYNGETSDPAPLTVTDSNPAIFTLNSQGHGDGVIMFPDFSLVTPVKAAKPGDVVVIWATGLGPVTFSETGPPLPGVELTEYPVEVWIGDKRAQVQFHGRNECCAGLDQINAVVPDGVHGCGTQVTLRSGVMTSPAVSLAVSDGGAGCSANAADILSRGWFQRGSVSLRRYESRQRNEIPGSFTIVSTTRGDAGTARFERISGDAGAALNAGPELPEPGTCVVRPIGQELPNVAAQPLDAGASLGVQGPNGPRTMGRGASLGYSGLLGTGVAGHYLDPGRYTVTGAGGDGVGGFAATVDVAAPLTWTNRESLHAVTRNGGVEVTWTGGDPGGFVLIEGGSIVVSRERTFGSKFTCRERTSAGRFFVRPHVLLQLPASAVLDAAVPAVVPGTLSVASATAGAAGGPEGLDFFSLSAATMTSQNVVWK